MAEHSQAVGSSRTVLLGRALLGRAPAVRASVDQASVDRRPVAGFDAAARAVLPDAGPRTPGRRIPGQPSPTPSPDGGTSRTPPGMPRLDVPPGPSGCHLGRTAPQRRGGARAQAGVAHTRHTATSPRTDRRRGPPPPTPPSAGREVHPVAVSVRRVPGRDAAVRSVGGPLRGRGTRPGSRPVQRGGGPHPPIGTDRPDAPSEPDSATGPGSAARPSHATEPSRATRPTSTTGPDRATEPSRLPGPDSATGSSRVHRHPASGDRDRDRDRDEACEPTRTCRPDLRSRGIAVPRHSTPDLPRDPEPPAGRLSHDRARPSTRSTPAPTRPPSMFHVKQRRRPDRAPDHAPDRHRRREPRTPASHGPQDPGAGRPRPTHRPSPIDDHSVRPSPGTHHEPNHARPPSTLPHSDGRTTDQTVS